MPFNYLDTSIKSKRSQSALEYMMTYGWAILIIVIVAVILYSMGIFNPSSSITFTSSGFSPFTVSSSLCNNIGYKIAVLAGPIPNNANSLTINKVYLTSATGANTTTASYTLTNPVTLKSGQSATILIPNVACNSANIHYSLSAKIQYSYTASTLGLQNVNTTGTVAGTSITGKPSTLTSYEPITITNTQSSATPSPFQQMINFTSSDPGFSSIATGNFGQNVEFFYYNGTVIPSWLENYTSTNGLWWLKIAAILGGSSETVYVGFAPTSVSLFNTVNNGEAPQLSPTYAEYDDGANVFLAYFNGNTPLADFNYYTTYVQLSQSKASLNGNNINVINDTRVAGSSGTLVPEFIFNVAIPNEPLYIESNTYLSATSTADNPRVALLSSNSPTSSLDAIGVNVGWSGAYFQEEYINNGKYTPDQAQQGSESIGWVYSSLLYIPKTSSYYGYTAPQLYSTAGGYSGSTTNTLPSTTSLYIGGIGGPNAQYTAQENAMLFNWMRARAYPPNGVMPSVSFSSVA
jgi:hypothetical protein